MHESGARSVGHLVRRDLAMVTSTSACLARTRLSLAIMASMASAFSEGCWRTVESVSRRSRSAIRSLISVELIEPILWKEKKST